MNLLHIYEILTHIEKETTGTVEAKLISGELQLRVNWWQYDFHYERTYTQLELEEAIAPRILIDFFIGKAHRLLLNHINGETQC